MLPLLSIPEARPLGVDGPGADTLELSLINTGSGEDVRNNW